MQTLHTDEEQHRYIAEFLKIPTRNSQHMLYIHGNDEYHIRHIVHRAILDYQIECGPDQEVSTTHIDDVKGISDKWIVTNKDMDTVSIIVEGRTYNNYFRWMVNLWDGTVVRFATDENN